MSYHIRTGVGSINGEVCEKAFYTAYCISQHMMKTLREEIKGKVVERRKKIADGALVDSRTLSEMQTIAQRYHLTFSREQVAAATIPNGPKSIAAYAWMVDHFSMIGDVEPAKKYATMSFKF